MDVQTVVENGIQLLNDRLGSLWVERIDLEELDMRYTFSCVLGQLFQNCSELNYSHYDFGISFLFGYSHYRTTNQADKISNHGFDASSRISYEDLTEEWKRRITEIRNGE